MSIHVKSMIIAAASALLAMPLPSRAEDDAQVAAVEYGKGRWATALAGYERASDRGDTAAAEVAGQMHLFGATLYGPAVRRDLQRSLPHLVRAARAGRPISAYLLDRIGFPREAWQPQDAPSDYVPGPSGC